MSVFNLSPLFPANEQQVIRRALRLLEKYQRQPSKPFTSTSFTKTWLQLQMAHQEREVFIVMYLDNQHCLLEREILLLARSAIPRYIPAKLLNWPSSTMPQRSSLLITIRPVRRKSASRTNILLSGS